MTRGGGRGPGAPPGMEWAEDPDYDKSDLTEAHIKSAYRMNLPSHMGDTDPCKRNCRHNPRCLAQIGEKTWFEMEIDDEEEELELEDELVRQDGLPAGLRNLGNTCYVNSFLQIWFHNTKFRQALYDWDPGEDPEEQDNESILDAELYEPRSKVASLQVLFSMMQYTKRKYVDPADFICKLGLDPSVQQDAQEFSKLFLSRLEDTLSHQAQARVKSMIQKQFRGEYAYVTSCLTCKNDSVRPEHFYELDLPLTGNKTLAECLADFLHKEKMTGDERYYCEQCQSKQEAIRCCKLRELPPVLNLQLNRFQYDMQLGRKKKLNSNIQFPEELDMGGYLPEGSPKSVYHLTGVLMHVGPDANHGHYIAHIQELETGNWFKFSDECVVPIQGKTLKLGNEEEATKKGKKASKGAQNSNNAYMLVYMLQESLMEIREVEVKEAIKRQAVRRAAVARIQERSRRKAEEERRRLEEEEDDDEEEDEEEDEENGNDVMTILEKVTDDEEEKNESTEKEILEKVEMNHSGDTQTTLNKQENLKETVEKEEIMNITKGVSGRRNSNSSAGSRGSHGSEGFVEHEESEYLFSNTRVFPKSFPQHLKTKIDRDNQEFDEEQEARHHSRMAEIHEQQTKRRTMILQYKGLRWDSDDEDGKMGRLDPDNEDSDEEEDSDDESWEFLPLDWLMSYFESPGTAGVIETRHLLCLHSKLDIDKLTEVKLVDSNMATQLYSDNGEGAGPRLNHEHLCRYCVNNKARLLSLECRMSRDNQFLAQERSPQDGTGFWVGKKSYLRWRHLARSELEDQIVEEVQHWKWQEETRMQAFREEQQRRILEMQKAKLQSIRGRAGAGAGYRGRGAAARAVVGERREQVMEARREPVVEGRREPVVEGMQGHPVNNAEPNKQMVEPKPRTGDDVRREVKGEVKQEAEVGKDSSLSLTDLQAKLQRMGTNVSVAPAGVGGRHPGAQDNNTGISVIKNGESFKLANIAEVKLNFSEEDRARNKPSCVVKPIVQSPPVKPSLAVKPFNVKPPSKVVNGTIDGEPVAKKACVAPLVNGEGDSVVRNGLINGHVNGRTVKTDPSTPDTVRLNANASLEKLTNGSLDSRTSSRSSSTDSQSSDPKTEDSEVSSQTNKSCESLGAKSDTFGGKTSGEDSPDKTSGEESEISYASSAPSTSTTVKSSDSKPSPPHKPLKRPNTGHNKSCGIAEETFNSDIMCPHGNLRVEQRFRQLISRAAWHRLRMYFRNPKTFQFGTPVCSECEEETNAATVQREKWREEANRQKARLADLFGDKGRPEWSKPSTQRVFLLSSHFVMAWRGFVRGLSGGKSEVREPITDVTNKMLVCEEHQGLLYPPLTDWENHPDPCVVMVHEEEWREIKEMFNVDLEIRVERTNTSQGPILTSTPGICSICVSNRQEAEAEDRLRYTNQIVFVRRISPDAKIPQPEPDPEFCTSPVPGDNKRLKMVGGEVVRRSSRRPRVRGETQFVIHSDMLLRDFKVKLMEVFKVAPYDQNLCINGEYLTETQKTMGQLKVLPGSLIFLRADEPTANAPCPQEDWVVQHPEQGFKGTGLLSS